MSIDSPAEKIKTKRAIENDSGQQILMPSFSYQYFIAKNISNTD